MGTSSGLPSANRIPDKIINAKIYNEADELLGTGELTLPSLEYMKESLSGLGIAGEFETPVIGHFSNLTISITWNTINTQSIELLSAKGHQINVFGSMQSYDGGTNKLIPKQIKLIANTLPKKGGIGKVAPGKKMDNDTELEVVSMQLWHDGKELIHIDKVNFICLINGNDELAEVRQHLGM